MDTDAASMDSGPGSSSSTAAAAAASTSTALTTPPITVHIHPTTGGHFDLQVLRNESVDCLKKMIAKRLKVPKERLCLLYRERHLRDGTLQQNCVLDGCKITLLPSVETGLLIQRPEQSVMQALESLSDAQVSDFLSGKAPLNLTMRLGDHMMFIQLQLSTVAPSTARKQSQSQPVPTSNTTTAIATNHSTLSTSSTTSSLSSSSPSPLSSSSNSSAVMLPLPASSTEDTYPSTSSSSSSAPTHWERPLSPRIATATAEVMRPVLDTKALAEASRNLTQTLRQLSSAALSSRAHDIEDSPPVRRRQGAIIESMHHHGRGVYSGTFSGTLNPALQDKHGRPKRDISTIIHILNDLLGATPQYRRHGSHHAITASAPNKFISDRPTSKEYHKLTLENKATRGKMEQLQMMMEERRARRLARREARAPYTWSANSKAAVKAASAASDSSCDSACESMDSSKVGENSAPEFCPMNTTETVVV